MAKIANIFIKGKRHISNNMKSPAMLIPFFIIKEQLITVSKASDKKSPIIGIKLSTANFAVLAANPSRDDAAKPWTEIIPVNIVSIIPNKPIATPLIKEASLDILTLSDILLTIDKTAENITIGMIVAFIIVAITVIEVYIMG